MGLNVQLDQEYVFSRTFFDEDISHNYTVLARESDMYHLLWQSYAVKAWELIDPLRAAIKDIIQSKEVYLRHTKHNSVDVNKYRAFLVKLLKACEENPGAEFRSYG